jgi:hypothetical protein
MEQDTEPLGKTKRRRIWSPEERQEEQIAQEFDWESIYQEGILFRDGRTEDL